ncbi:Lrp/AsnC family transcriptional regulator [Spiractinospora alimapuensis]|nr:Lrp/AsnC family transcriptional regulator [Spiractinospora alimapuensis]QVQ54664.1 Lrp/AsnC family transcriptional regulator [Spiractinospora alimapuensis]
MLDAIDAALIKALQTDGRATYQTLAEGVGLSRTAVRARVRRMLTTGAIRVVGIPHAGLTGMQVFALVEFTVHGASEHLVTELQHRDSVIFAAHTAGRVPVVAYLRTANDNQLATELATLRRVTGVARTDVFRAAVGPREPVGASDPRAAVDGLDWRLIRLLQEDGRASYAELARHVGLSQAATRSRVVRLIGIGMVHVTALLEPATMGVNECVGFGAHCRGDAAAAAAHLGRVPGVNFAISGFGRFDVIGVVAGADRAGVVETLGAVRSLADITEVETWAHLGVVKERHRVARDGGQGGRTVPGGAFLPRRKPRRDGGG